ncbi:MAG: glycoside hydrolase family 97 catalytic domain-containing protein [candidate division KSB1 bacterium]|nr:glycoside hydrolase family 97 catalytic domain-containing protein [candidate division KSB1 bacterium]
MKSYTLYSGLMFFLIICVSCLNASEWEASSPDDRLRLIVKKDADEYLYYCLTCQNSTILDWSKLSMGLEDRMIGRDLIISNVSIVAIQDEYRLVHGKQKSVRYKANEMVLSMQDQKKQQYNIMFRVYNDGLAFRYGFLGSQKQLTLNQDLTTFCVNKNSTGFLQPYQKPGKNTPSYEESFYHLKNLSQTSPTGVGWAFPALYSIEGDRHWMLVTEAGLDETQCAFHFKTGNKTGEYRFVFPEPDDGNNYGNAFPECDLCWYSPWRVFIVGDSLEDIVESTLITHVNPPAQKDDYSWVRPGRVSWSWWSTRPNSVNYNYYKKFIDLAADMNWEYSLIDAGWPELGENQIIDLVNYAKTRNVDIILWYNSGGPQSGSHHSPMHRLWQQSIRREEMQWLNKIGVKGIKVDFFVSDKQEIIKYYLDILKDAAEFQLMVNFHGCTLPRGWSRTYPNLMTMEAVNGAERYLFKPSYKDKSPEQNTILPFTRNVVGPMDFTPVTFSAESRKTTQAHELALSVIFQSGWQHFPDKPDVYQQSQWNDFLQKVSSDWDDVHYIDGYPGDFVCLARRHKDDWYFAAINSGSEKTIKMSLDFINPGEYKSTLYHDESEHSKTMQVSPIRIKTTDIPEIPVGENGGFVFVLKNSFKK